jgi:hypothetical protein
MRVSLAVLSLLLAATACGGESAAGSDSTESMDVAWGGVGGAYFMASPGPLVVDIEKRDLNRRGVRAELRAILFAPDRKVVGELRLADDGRPRGSGPGPIQRGQLRTEVASQGVYGMNITVAQDRYGEEVVWGFRTNCAKYLIETSRGHRDERHREPIVLHNSGRPGDVCFLPPGDDFEISLDGLPESARDVEVYDSSNTLIARLAGNQQGQVTHTISRSAGAKPGPWRLHLAEQVATIDIDGVTRWDARDPYPNLSYWTTKPAAFFPLPDFRWLLSPYSRTVYGPAGSQGSVRMRVHNNSPRPINVALALEFPDERWPVSLSTERVELAPKKDRIIDLSYTISADGTSHTCRVRATPLECPDFTTYSTITARSGDAPALQPLTLPLVLRPYEHENEQLGYAPDYPVQNQLYFDLRNRALVQTDSGLARYDPAGWQDREIAVNAASNSANRRTSATSIVSTKIAFDADNDIYLLGGAGGRGQLLHSSDGGATFTAYDLPGEARAGTLDFEQFSGHNVPEGPPPIIRFRQTAADSQRIWRRINDLELIVFEKQDGRLQAAEPVFISRQCIGFSSHSGAPSSVVSRAGKVHVVWGEATDPAAKVAGVPTFVATYDRATRQLSEPALVAYGPPANDIHNSPSITLDSQGYLHVLAGTHGAPFPYTRSLQPNTSEAGWTPAEPVGSDLRQTYIGLVCGPDDTLHLVYRLWQSEVEPHPASQFAVLAYSRKPAGKPWEAPKPLVVPPFSEYSVFYHRLTIDRAGRLFLSYDYWSTFWFYRTDHWGDRRAVLLSPDGGQTWRLLAGQDLATTQ